MHFVSASVLAQHLLCKGMASMLGREQLIVIGNGMVGLEFCVQAVRRSLNIRYHIIVFGEEPVPAYDRIRLTECMDDKDGEELLLRDRSWYADNGITLCSNARVESINTAEQSLRVQTHDGDAYTETYQHLVLATGSRPFIPPIDQVADDKIFSYRTLDDIAAIKAACATERQNKKAVIIGGGLLGLELAKAIQEHDVATTVVEFAPGLMLRQLNPVASSILHEQILSLGIQVRIQTSTAAIEAGTDNRLRVRYDDGAIDDADLVVFAAGIRPRDELAREAEIRCSPGSGIVINDFLETSAPHVYAIGECAIHDGRVYGLAAPGYHMAEILCKRLNGGARPAFRGFDLSTKLKLAGLDVWTIGDYQADGKTVSYRSGNVYRQLVVRYGRVVGATIIGGFEELALLQDAVARRVELSNSQLQSFQKGGELFRDDLDNPINWPEQAIICTCMQVKRLTLTMACDAGCKTADDLSKETGAGTVCGSCKPLLNQIVGAEIPEEANIAHGNKTLLRFSMLAALLIIPFVCYSIPFDASVEHGSGWDIIWRDGVIKQITGFTTLGISVLALFLSVRKRMLPLGNYGWWRAIHGILGTLSLIVLIAHTGFRLGANLNMALSMSFLGLALIGAGSGALSAMENRIGGSRIRAVRLWWTRAHIAFVWLFIPLVIFHILKVYAY